MNDNWRDEMTTPQARVDALLDQMNRYAPLVNALSRIATNDGYGDNGNLTAYDMQVIATKALIEFHTEWIPLTPVAKNNGGTQ